MKKAFMALLFFPQYAFINKFIYFLGLPLITAIYFNYFSDYLTVMSF